VIRSVRSPSKVHGCNFASSLQLPWCLTAQREISLAEKGAILFLFYLRYYFAAISLIPGWSWSTVLNFVTCATNCQFFETHPHRGRPCILTRCQWRSSIWPVNDNSQIIQAELRDLYAPNVSLSTINQYLHQHNYRKWQVKKRPNHEERHVFQKLQWALEH